MAAVAVGSWDAVTFRKQESINVQTKRIMTGREADWIMMILGLRIAIESQFVIIQAPLKG
jgi:hypothetical protein